MSDVNTWPVCGTTVNKTVSPCKQSLSVNCLGFLVGSFNFHLVEWMGKEECLCFELHSEVSITSLICNLPLPCALWKIDFLKDVNWSLCFITYKGNNLLVCCAIVGSLNWIILAVFFSTVKPFIYECKCWLVFSVDLRCICFWTCCQITVLSGRQVDGCYDKVSEKVDHLMWLYARWH